MTMTAEQVHHQLQLGIAAYTDGQWQQAGEIYGALFAEPEAQQGIRELHWNYAVCMANLGDHDLALQHMQAGGFAEADYTPVLAHVAGQSAGHTANAGAHDAEIHELTQRAWGYYQAQMWQEAADGYAELLIQPGFPDAELPGIHWNLAMCYAHLGDWTTAGEHLPGAGHTENDLREAMGHVNHQDVHAQLDNAAHYLRSQDWHAALDLYGQVLIAPGVDTNELAAVRGNLALCYAHLDDWQAAYDNADAGGISRQDFHQEVMSAGLTPPP